MLRFMWSSALITPLPSQRPGRALLLPEACANSSVSSVCSRNTLASPSIWTPSQDSLMMLQMPLAVLFCPPHSAFSQLRFGPCRGHHFRMSRTSRTFPSHHLWKVTSAFPPAGSSSSSIGLALLGSPCWTVVSIPSGWVFRVGLSAQNAQVRQDCFRKFKNFSFLEIFCDFSLMIQTSAERQL